MLDGMSMDQLRTFIAAADEGSGCDSCQGSQLEQGALVQIIHFSRSSIGWRKNQERWQGSIPAQPKREHRGTGFAGPLVLPLEGGSLHEASDSG